MFYIMHSTVCITNVTSHAPSRGFCTQIETYQTVHAQVVNVSSDPTDGSSATNSPCPLRNVHIQLRTNLPAYILSFPTPHSHSWRLSCKGAEASAVVWLHSHATVAKASRALGNHTDPTLITNGQTVPHGLRSANMTFSAILAPGVAVPANSSCTLSLFGGGGRDSVVLSVPVALPAIGQKAATSTSALPRSTRVLREQLDKFWHHAAGPQAAGGRRSLRGVRG